MRKIAIVAVALAALAGAAHAKARPGPVPPPGEWTRAAVTGDPLTIETPEGPLAVRLRANRVLFRHGGAPAGVTALTGSIPGEPESWVRVTSWPGSLAGYVVGSRGVYRIDVRHDRGSIARDAGVGPAGPIEPRTVGESCDSLRWTPQIASPLYIVQGAPDRIFDVAFAVDGSFVENEGEEWAAVATAHVNAIDGLFDASFDVRLAVVHLVDVPDSAIPGATTTQLLDGLQALYQTTYADLARENAHLFTGRDLTNAAGQVKCVGSAGRTSVSYSVGTTVGGPFNFGPLVLLPDVAVKVSAHELAHTLSAHHHYANCAEPLPTYAPINTTDACTVMINDWGLIQLKFGALERLTVRGWADFYGI